MASVKRAWSERIPADNFDALQPGTSLQAVRVAHQAADAVARFEQPRHEPSADVSSCTSDEDEFG